MGVETRVLSPSSSRSIRKLFVSRKIRIVERDSILKLSKLFFVMEKKKLLDEKRANRWLYTVEDSRNPKPPSYFILISS